MNAANNGNDALRVDKDALIKKLEADCAMLRLSLAKAKMELSDMHTKYPAPSILYYGGER